MHTARMERWGRWAEPVRLGIYELVGDVEVEWGFGKGKKWA